jgi:hypothetical protein
MQNYITSFSFHPMSPVKAYLLGLAWADGYIGSNGTRFSISSKEKELEQISCLFYPDGRPLETRKDGVRILMVYSKKIVQELITFGFTPRKSYQGKPLIPQGYEKYFLLGLLDGDGCIHISKTSLVGMTIRVYYSGNQHTMEHVRSIIAEQLGIQFTLRQPQSTKDRFIHSLKINDHKICTILSSNRISHTLQYLEWLYDSTERIPLFERKYNIYQSFLTTWSSRLICPLCGDQFDRSSSTARYCVNCRTLLRRLRNRQQDHMHRKGIRLPLTSHLLREEKQRIDVDQLEEICFSRENKATSVSLTEIVRLAQVSEGIGESHQG